MAECSVDPQIAQKVAQLRCRISDYENWIATNRRDVDGVKDRREWIAECEAEIEQLTN